MSPLYERKGAEMPQQLPQELLDEVQASLANAPAPDENKPIIPSNGKNKPNPVPFAAAAATSYAPPQQTIPSIFPNGGKHSLEEIVKDNSALESLLTNFIDYFPSKGLIPKKNGIRGKKLYGGGR